MRPSLEPVRSMVNSKDVFSPKSMENVPLGSIYLAIDVLILMNVMNLPINVNTDVKTHLEAINV